MKYTINDFHKKAIEDYQLQNDWPQEVLTETKIIDSKILKDDSYIDLPFVTIDGEDAKDFDDAIFCELIPDGFNLKVAIADVSHYVKENSALDDEAMKRATSTYLPRKVIPMLPEKLSNEVCSLQPNRYRRVLYADILLDKDGHVTSYEFKRAMIKSAARLTYNEVESYLKNGFQKLTGDFKQSLETSYLLFQKLLDLRSYRGALELEISEPILKLNSEGNIKSLFSKKRMLAHQLIEEFMLVANVCAANILRKNFSNSVFRNHDYPESLKIDRLSQSLKRRGLNWNGSPEDVNNLPILMDRLKNRPDKSTLHIMVLQSMQRATYESICKGHFGLKFEEYTHFTSPIRRYPDLMVHRLLKNLIDKRAGSLSNDALEDWDELLEHCSIKERDSEFASKQVTQSLICSHCKQFKGKSFKGYISGVKDFGLFVDIPELFTTGMLHVSELPSDRYSFNARSQSLDGRRRGNKFIHGEKIEVYIGEIFELEGKISLYY
ncbi:MAG: VacB/RNase II family 3'-5' exoribonuclease [SAR86 cluster bacterium]|nr:VacB/RNase II family 3'-5' exoribonuclease [SAR86 cluster bacterium]